jgi:hypothetical protein
MEENLPKIYKCIRCDSNIFENDFYYSMRYSYDDSDGVTHIGLARVCTDCHYKDEDEY